MNGTEFGKDYNTIRSKCFLCDEIGVLYMYMYVNVEWITAENALKKEHSVYRTNKILTHKIVVFKHKTLERTCVLAK